MFGRPKKIRKDVGDLTLADLNYASVWEFCLDEEDVEGQTECTVRPIVKGPAFDPVTCSGIVVCDFHGPVDPPLVGLVAPSGEFEGPWSIGPTLFLDKPIGEVSSHPLLKKYNMVMSASSPRIGLALPWPIHEPEENVRTLMNIAYQVLGRTPDQLFPLTCRLRRSVLGWPDSFEIPGFIRPVDHGGAIYEPVR